MLTRGCLALLLALLATSRAHAQEDDTTDLAAEERTLRATLATSPRDTGARCSLGWVLVRLERGEEAAPMLDDAIKELTPHNDPAPRQRLARCLYSRGRASELLGDAERARASYRRSLGLRASDAVTLRLATLDLVAAASAACEAEHGGRCVPARLSALDQPAVEGDGILRVGACEGDEAWVFVLFATRTGHALWAATRHPSGRAVARALDGFMRGTDTVTLDVGVADDLETEGPACVLRVAIGYTGVYPGDDAEDEADDFERDTGYDVLVRREGGSIAIEHE